ncbi:MAG: hypothetical protein AABW55_06930 [Thermoproteota archaeon]
MGYLRNQLATVVTGAFATALSLLWIFLGSAYPILHFIFTMAVPITWFLTAMCYLAQKSKDYMHKYDHGHDHDVKKKLNEPYQIVGTRGTTQTFANITDSELSQTKSKLGNQVEELRNTVKLKESEINQLKQKIENLETMVQIEALKTELANIKALASKEKTKRKTKRKVT